MATINKTLVPSSATTNIAPNSSPTSSRQSHQKITSVIIGGSRRCSEDPAPVAYLKTLFENIGGTGTCKRSLPSSFNKPSQEHLDAYSLEAVRAIRSGDTDKLRGMIQEGKSLDACNRFGESLLHMACRRGDEAMVKLLLLEANLQLDIRDDFGRTALHDACWTSKPNFAVVDLLFKVCPPDMLLAEDVRGHTPFHYARKEHWDDWLDFLKARNEALTTSISAYFSVVG